MHEHSVLKQYKHCKTLGKIYEKQTKPVVMPTVVFISI